MDAIMRRLQRGFTVVEMLVAIAVAGLLVSLVYGAIRVGQRSVSALDSRVEQSELMRIGWQFIHDAITHAGPAADPASAGAAWYAASVADEAATPVDGDTIDSMKNPRQRVRHRSSKRFWSSDSTSCGSNISARPNAVSRPTGRANGATRVGCPI